MEKLINYRKIIKSLLREFGAIKPVLKGIELQLIEDDEKGHYILLNLGWDNLEPVYSTIIHIDIKDEKIWIQQDWTDAAIADRLVEKGIPKTDIVLGFLAPYKRPYTEFAIS